MVNKFIGENMIYDIANLKVEIKNENLMLGGGEAGTSSIGGKVGVKYAF